ncbi:MAG: phasin family protein [Bacillota bacterium]
MSKLEDLLYRSIGSLDMTVDKLEDLVRALVEEGELSKKEGKRIIEKWQEKGDKQKEKIDRVIDDRLDDLGLAKKDDVDKIKERLARLETKIDQLSEKLSSNNEE